MKRKSSLLSTSAAAVRASKSSNPTASGRGPHREVLPNEASASLSENLTARLADLTSAGGMGVNRTPVKINVVTHRKCLHGSGPW